MKKILLLLFFCNQIYSQDYKKEKTIFKHSDEINSITTTKEYFATSSLDKSVIVWNYEGKKIYKYKIDNGKINTLKFIPKSNILLIAATEKIGKKERFILKSFDIKGNLIKEFIDSTLTQSYVDSSYSKNSNSVIKANSTVVKSFPSLNLSPSLNIPQVKYGLSHIELIQSISISPNNKLIATIDYFRNINIWDLNGNKIYKTQIYNNKKRTNIFFISDTALFVTPNINLNIKSNTLRKVGDYGAFMTLPLKSKLYCYFDYDNSTQNEKIVDITSNLEQTVDSKNVYSLRAISSENYFLNLGIDRLIRLRDENGKTIATFGKSKKESTRFRGKNLITYSNITEIGISPNSDYVISGTKDGKVTIWKNK